MSYRHLLLKAAEIADMPGEQKTHFLNPNGIRLNKALGDAVGLGHLGVHLITVLPGHDAGEFHMHFYEEECAYVLSGRGLLSIEDEQFEVGAGDFFGFPRSTAAHNLCNNGSEPLQCLVLGQRLEHDVADYPHRQKRLYRNSGEWNVVDLKYVSNPKEVKAKTERPAVKRKRKDAPAGAEELAGDEDSSQD
jgi:uncharacterized cupin superfamily protein